MSAMNKEHSFTILLGGDVTPTKRLATQIADTRVIAADSGIAHAAALGLLPELWVGDFDSTSDTLAATYAAVPREVYPEAKDATDGAIAIEAALARGAKQITLVGAMGGRFDHALAHGMQLIDLQSRGIKAFASSGHEEVYPLLHEAEFDDIPAGTRLSVLGLSDLTGLSINGVRWPLNKRDVPLGSTLTLSNESTGLVSIMLEEGTALIVVYPPADHLA